MSMDTNAERVEKPAVACPHCGKMVRGMNDHMQAKHSKLIPGQQKSKVELATGYTRQQVQALDLLARGGARYGTRIEDMRFLKERGLCYAHDKGSNVGNGRWTWRPTPEGRSEHARVHDALRILANKESTDGR